MLDGAIAISSSREITDSAPEDSALIRRIAHGDKDAFSVFLNRYLGAMVAFARRYIGNRSDAEDIAQEAFTRVWTHADSWRETGASPRSWLYRITYNLCIDELRKKRPLLEEHDLVSEDTPEKRLTQDIDEATLRQMINALPDRQRSAIWLSAYHGLSNKEASEILGTTVEAMESLLTRARRNLRERLQLDQQGNL